MEKKYIYIIGEIPKNITEETIKKFNDSELDLISIGFRVYNPLLNNITNTNGRKAENIQQLLKCDAVYVLPCAPINNSNLELKMATVLNLLVIHAVDKR